MNEYYVGITIGPIIETLKLASRPASLWCASAMFSWLSEEICNRALGIGGDIISPYYSESKSADQYSITAEGVGKYHDRIIFRLKYEDKEKLNAKIREMVENAKNALADALISDKLALKAGHNEGELKEIIKSYLQVRYIIEEKTDSSDKNCILRLSPYLDATELCAEFSVDQSVQPIAALFEGTDEEHGNSLVKLCFGIEKGNTTVLNRNGKVRDINSIADRDSSSDRKIFNYYAIVQADGDNIGKLLASLKSDDEVKTFSENCLKYTTTAAGLISEFGGMTIYAGGDDLLFICPLESKGKNIFELCSEILDEFIKKFGEDGPTLSFGISVNYEKFPLYEAFADALILLEEAKKVKKGEKKNKSALRIRKSSGQSAKFRFTNKGIIYDQLQCLLKHPTDTVVLNSMLYKIGLYRPIIIASLSSGRDIKALFKNLFDSEYHSTVKDYIDTVRTALETVHKEIKDGSNKNYLTENIFDVHPESEEESIKSDEELAIDVLFSMLRTARFFSEKRNRREEESDE